MKPYIVFITFLILLSPIFSNAQNAKKADKAYESEQYFEAITLYKLAYSKIKNKVEKQRIIFQISDCYRLTKNLRKAEQQYKKLVKLNYHDPIIYLYYAEILRDQEKYQEAIEQYKIYTTLAPEDPRGSMGEKSIIQAIKWIDKPNTNYKVENIRKINSRNDDFSPTFADKKYKNLVFSSSRKESDNDVDPNTGLGYTWLYVTTKDAKGNWSKPVNIDEEKMINTTNENNGSATFNRKFNTIYFTRCHVQKNVKGRM